MTAALLVLEDGEVFHGVSFGSAQDSAGEVVFNTSMTGYQEVLTDPSYDGQIIAMTYPHIGNYGVNDEDLESSRPRVAGFVIRDLPVSWSSWRGRGSLEDYLDRWGIAGIAEVDTRRLTRHIRSKGAMRGVIVPGGSDPGQAIERARSAPGMVGLDLVGNVSTGKPYTWPAEDARFRVAAYDYGIKLNILRRLAEHGCETVVYPSRTPAAEVLAGQPDGVFLSNGPGDPDAVGYAAETIRALIGRKPVFGICLGHQLLALAGGLRTYKLPFGHRGANHPVVRLSDGRIEVTTQNHGFAVEAGLFGLDAGSALAPGLFAPSGFGKAELTHVNLNDRTVEGFRLVDEPAFAVQYHPEAGPGPHDARYLFDEFCSLMGS